MNVYQILVIVILNCVWGSAFREESDELGDIDLGCPPRSYRLDNYCYLYQTVTANYYESQRKCELGGGSLAVVNSQKIHWFLMKLRLYKLIGYWFGLDMLTSERVWRYSDGSPAGRFTKWAPGEPNNYRNRQDCARLEMRKNLLWDDDFCDDKWRYICQFEGNNCTNTDRLSLRTSCFEISKKLTSYNNAKQQCRDKGGNLATINSESIFKFLKNLVYKDRNVFEISNSEATNIFRTNINSIPAVWIGVSQDSGKWIYQDGNEVDFTMWEINNPKNISGRKGCVWWFERWRHVSCDGGSRPYICQYPASFAMSSPTSTSASPTITTTASSSSSKLTDEVIVQSEQPPGLCLSTTNFTFLLFMVFFIGAMFVPCTWGIVSYFRRSKNADKNSYGDTLHIVNHEETSY